jgi:hypothetical protein
VGIAYQLGLARLCAASNSRGDEAMTP